METWQRDRLETGLNDITKDLDYKHCILQLRVKLIFDENDGQEIINEVRNPTDVLKRLSLINILKTRGNNAYWTFCHIIRSKHPDLFDALHELPEDKESQPCTVCGHEGDSQQHCVNCQGLVKMTRDYALGTFIEFPEELPQFLRSCHEQITSLKASLAQRDEEIIGMREQNNGLVNRALDDGKALTDFQRKMEEKDQIVSESTLAKQTVMIENEQLRMDIDQQQREALEKDEALEKLRQQVQKFEQSYEDNAKQENDAVYANQISVLRQEVDDVRNQLSKEMERSISLKKEFTLLKQTAARLKIEKEASEHIVQRQNDEHSKKFCELEQSIVFCQDQLEKKQDEVQVLCEQIDVIKCERAEALQDRDQLLSKLYEKENASVNFSEKSDALESSLSKVMAENDDLLKKMETLKVSNDHWLTQWEVTKTERETAKAEYEKLQKNRDDIVLKLVETQRKFSADTVKSKEWEERQEFMKQHIEELENQVFALSSLREGEFEVILERVPNAKFGVKFGNYHGRPMIGQSKIIISGIDVDVPIAALQDIKVGDFVTRINGYCIEEGNMELVRQHTKMNQDRLVLALRHPLPNACVEPDPVLRLGGPDAPLAVADWGLDLAVVVKNIQKGSHAELCGLYEFDELLQVNNRLASELSLIEVFHKMAKHQQCQLKIRRSASIYMNGYSDRNALSTRDCHFRGSMLSSSSSVSAVSVPSAITEHSSSSSSRAEYIEPINSMNTAPALPPKEPTNNRNTERSRAVSEPPPAPPKSESISNGSQHYGNSINVAFPIDETTENDIKYYPTFAELQDSGKITTTSSTSSIISSTSDTTSETTDGDSTTCSVPEIPPRRQSTAPILPAPNPSKYRVSAYSQHDGNYSYVHTKFYDEHGHEIKSPSPQNIYENNLEIVVRKPDYVQFGFQIVGGNMTGIFVKKVENWTPAYNAKIKAGWRLVKVNDMSLENVAYCYAQELMIRLSSEQETKFLFHALDYADYESIISKKPHDLFHIRALEDYNARSPEELSFKKGDIMCVTDSYHISDYKQPHRWCAQKEEMGHQISGLIPRQLSESAKCSDLEHEYEPMPGDPISEHPGTLKKEKKGLLKRLKRGKTPNIDFVDHVRLYEVLDNVNMVLV